MNVVLRTLWCYVTFVMRRVWKVKIQHV